MKSFYFASLVAARMYEQLMHKAALLKNQPTTHKLISAIWHRKASASMKKISHWTI